jgi:hypothetical protein
VPGLGELGRLLLIVGGIIVLLGLFLALGDKLPFLGRLPGDIRIQRDNISCTFPLATSILLSIILTVLLNILLRILRK